jgi:hypothetical protein
MGTERQTERHTNRKTGRKTYEQKDRQKDIQTEREQVTFNKCVPRLYHEMMSATKK